MSNKLTILEGIGQALEEKLAKINIYTIDDLIFHLPIKYYDKTRITPIGTIRDGDSVLIVGEITNVCINKYGRPNLCININDHSGSLTLRFIYFNRSQKENFIIGKSVVCFGQVNKTRSGYSIIHPEYRLCNNENIILDETLTPIYQLTKGLSNKVISKIITKAMLYVEKNIILPEVLSNNIISKWRFPALLESLKYIHNPPPNVNIEKITSGLDPAVKRLKFEELLAYKTFMLQNRNRIKDNNSVVLSINGKALDMFYKNLPFKLTNSQNAVIADINNDIARNQPMMRLIQGDVGCGKTVVAAHAIVCAVQSGYQVVFMAPTELLAEQHYKNLQIWLEELGISVCFLCGSKKARLKKEVLSFIKKGDVSVIIGTHAVFQDKVEFNSLGLIIIDEQHRFGVQQRLSLLEKGIKNNIVPHQLMMTATPIPRTIAMVLYSDLDISIIDELPPGRKPIKTIAICNTRRQELLKKIIPLLENNGQIYWVCPLIEESDVIESEAAETTFEQVKSLLPNFNIGIIHGRKKSVEKEEIMSDFKNNKIHVLVATTVIEVGVDVPNASIMIIENAERMGLSQLHQLRGRIGRGNKSSYCILMYKSPLKEVATKRLNIMRESQDGFAIANQDLKIRGSGEILGTKQTGWSSFRIADLLQDQDLLVDVNKESYILNKNKLDNCKIIIDRWLKQKKNFIKS